MFSCVVAIPAKGLRPKHQRKKERETSATTGPDERRRTPKRRLDCLYRSRGEHGDCLCTQEIACWEAVGHLVCVLKQNSLLLSVKSQAVKLVRSLWAQPSAGGAHVVATVLSNPAHLVEWGIHARAIPVTRTASGRSSLSTDTRTHEPRRGATRTHEPRRGATRTHEPSRGATRTHEPRRGPTRTQEPRSDADARAEARSDADADARAEARTDTDARAEERRGRTSRGKDRHGRKSRGATRTRTHEPRRGATRTHEPSRGATRTHEPRQGPTRTQEPRSDADADARAEARSDADARLRALGSVRAAPRPLVRRRRAHTSPDAHRGRALDRTSLRTDTPQLRAEAVDARTAKQ
ncbi:hypothetical protein F2P81_013498 [Scophthalmus maximus]|uniref:Uncharacterized protein n=1 Tax=Scophthalmus maximus TaxID=52904 RepID=A0A6A4STJ5_SCOMX|nr:hypothetical protein F2P81_013498 [Scophthalmus maximus]